MNAGAMSIPGAKRCIIKDFPLAPTIKDVISPAPVTTQLDGVRVKINYDKYHELIENIVIDGKKLSEIADIKKSKMYDYILVKINSESSLIEDSN